MAAQYSIRPRQTDDAEQSGTTGKTRNPYIVAMANSTPEPEPEAVPANAQTSNADAQSPVTNPQTPTSTTPAPAQSPAQIPQQSGQISQQSAQISQQSAQIPQQSVQVQQLPHADTSSFQSYLDRWYQAAQKQSDAQIDRATAQGVTELARTQQDAQEQFQTQQNQIDIDEARAKDNQTLRMAAQGNRGGIGNAQYDSIAAAAMRNRVTVSNARTKLANDTARQIADLRAQGEFQKADNLLQLTQQYLSQLMSLEQWAQEYNLSVDQLNAQLTQWAESYALQREQMQISAEQWRREFEYNQRIDQRNYDYTVRRDAIADQRYATEYADSRADVAWQQGMTERQYADSRSDAEWQKNMTEREYADSRADTEWNKKQQEKADAVQRANTMINAGIMPDSSTLSAAGMSKNEAQLMVSAVRTAKELAQQQTQYENLLKQNEDTRKDAELMLKTLQENRAAQQQESEEIRKNNEESRKDAELEIKQSEERRKSEESTKKNQRYTKDEIDDEIKKGNLTAAVMDGYEYWYGENYYTRHPDALSDKAKTVQKQITKITGAQREKILLSAKQNLTDAEYRYLSSLPTQTSSAGLDNKTYQTAVANIKTGLQNDDFDGAVANLDAIWSRLNAQQIQRIQATLAQYGYRYSPN